MPAADSLFDRERSSLARLQQLVRDRAAGETELLATFQTAADAAEREVAKSRKLLAAERSKVTAELDGDHQAKATAISEKYDTAQQNADGKRQEFRKRTVDQYSAAIQKARDEFSDKLWTAESVREAGDKEAQDAFDDALRKAAAGDARVEAIWDKAGQGLAKLKLTRDDIQVPETKLPPPDDGDPLPALAKRLDAADAAATKLLAGSLGTLGGPAGLLIFIPAFVAVLAGAGFAAVGGPTGAGIGAGAGLVVGLIAWIVAGVAAKKQARERGAALGAAQAEAVRAGRRLRDHAAATMAQRMKALHDAHEDEKQKAAAYYEPKIAGLQKQLDGTLTEIDGKHAKVSENIRTGRSADTKNETSRYTKATKAATDKLDADSAVAEARFRDKMASATTTRDAATAAVAHAWTTGLAEVTATCRHLADFGAGWFPDWPSIVPTSRKLPTDAPGGVRFGEFAVDMLALPDAKPADPKLMPAEPLKMTVPAYLPFPQGCSVLLKTRDEGRPAAVVALQAMMLRFLTGLPPGKVRFTIVDPVGLGENFASFMHLADHDDKLVTSRIWTEPSHIEKRLEDLTEHMENVIQKYLRNQYKSIEDYNREAGEVAEPYRVLVIANFPTSFSADAARRLISVMSSGPACGVCTLVSWDAAAALPRDFKMADIEQVAFNLGWDGGKFVSNDPAFRPFPLTLDVPPDQAVAAQIVRRVGEESKTAGRVEVPFEYIAPAPDKVWAGSTSKAFDLPVGRAGATRRQNFMIGLGTSQHALIAGKTGSGKSTMLHALITNIALTYSPDEAELYLIDFKKGVEFRAYAVNKLPHARVIAIESEREFGLSVLQRLDGIMKERGEKYRAAGANDLKGYRAARPDEKTPRCLLVIDEFQEFFTEDDKLSQEAALLMDRIVRQGRAFGVHMMLGSQSLGGAFSVGRATLDQMAVRIALQCSEADAQLILSKDNTAARLLNRPGEAIYNDANGRVEGNYPFQVVWLSDEKRTEYLKLMREKAVGRDDPEMLVFEGSEAADLSRNKALNRLIAAPADALPAGPPTVWLGDAVAIKDPTAAVLRPQSSANVLFIGQHEEGALGLMGAALVGLAAKLRPAVHGTQTGPASGRSFTIIDGTPDDGEYAGFLRNAADALGFDRSLVERSELDATMGDLLAEMNRRQNGESADRSPRIVLIHGLHRLRELRKPEDDFAFGRGKGEKKVSAGEAFASVLRDGPPVGIHFVVWVDSLTNLQRALDRGGLREFALRVLFQMSAADSSNLLDSPVASRLGKNRALYMEEGTERPEKFRPYALPAASWLRKVGDQLGTAAPAEAVPA